ncbi:MAG: hypothetical protein GY856_53005 [bacterium]|nr:hypothetical protein [bacterium]
MISSTMMLWIGLVLLAVTFRWLLGVRYIPHQSVGVVEKLWSFKGSLDGGRIIAFHGEAGFQAGILRGGIQYFYFPWQYRIHREPLVLIAEGRIGYVYARDGHALAPNQTLGRACDCNNFQDARAYLAKGGQRGRQRVILREGVYAVNLAQFVVITEERIYTGPIASRGLDKQYSRWQAELRRIGGFSPVVIGVADGRPAEEGEAEHEAELVLTEGDTIGIVTVHDGPVIESGEIIAPEVKPAPSSGGEKGHSYFQDPEAFLALGGHRGKQLQVLTDGTFFINRWFATVEVRQKTLIPIGFVGVVVSYHGVTGEDVTGTRFRYGEQVEPGHRGVWKRALPPGKYPLNPYALAVEPVPTVNFVLRWITGRVEAHEYDRDLKSIELITADGFEPQLPLSLVLHIDYEKAPRVVQRFGNVKKLISQTLDPILAAYFRDVAQHVNMLDLLTKREEIQRRATASLGECFQAYDITCVAVLIGRPESLGDQYQPGEDPIEHLFDQLRSRRLAEEQILTYAKQEDAALKRKELNRAQAEADKQTELTETKVDVEITANRGQAQLEEARRLAKRDIARASGEARSRELIGRGEAAKIGQTGFAEAAVFLQKIRAYGDSRLFALHRVSEQLARSQQPLVPERLLMMGPDGNDGQQKGITPGPLGHLLTLLLAEKADLGLTTAPEGGLAELERYRDQLMSTIEQGWSGDLAAPFAGDEEDLDEAGGGEVDGC